MRLKLLAPVTAKRERLTLYRLGNTRQTILKTMDNHQRICFLAKTDVLLSKCPVSAIYSMSPLLLWAIPEYVEVHSLDMRISIPDYLIPEVHME